MNKEDKIISILKTASKKHSLSSSQKAELKFNLMDVIKSGDARTSKHTPYNLTNRRFTMPLIPVLIAVLLVSASGTAVLANDAKPGDALYGLDQLVEKLETELVLDEEAKVKLVTSLSQERIAELEAIQNAKAEGSADAQTRWEEHKADAMARVAASIEKLNQLEAKFQARLDAETDPKARTRLEKIISHLQVVEERREKLIDKIEEREFPVSTEVESNASASVNTGLPKAQLKANSRAWLNLTGEEKAQIHKELRNQFRFEDEDEDDDDKGTGNDDDDESDDSELESSNSSSGSLKVGL